MGQAMAAHAANETVRQVVMRLLTERDKLLPDATRFTECPIVRGGSICGIHFTMQGPRSVLLTAIWDFGTQTLWCYDSNGFRFCTEKVLEPDPTP